MEWAEFWAGGLANLFIVIGLDHPCTRDVTRRMYTSACALPENLSYGPANNVRNRLPMSMGRKRLGLRTPNKA